MTSFEPPGVIGGPDREDERGGTAQSRVVFRWSRFGRMLAGDAPAVVERILRAYLEHRASYEERFVDFVKRVGVERLKEIVEREALGV